jgi:rubrerythrin
LEAKKRRRYVTRDLSKTRVIKDSRKETGVAEEAVHFNEGFMPGNSYRCNGCKEGFMIPPGYPVQCPHCDSKDLAPHSENWVND